MTLGLLQPAWLFLLLLVPLVWFVPRPTRDVRHAALRSIVLALIALGLARPVSWSDGGVEHHVVILDLTESVAAADVVSAREAARKIRDGLDDDARCTLVVLGSTTDAGAGSSYDEVIRLAGDGSPLADAMALANRRVPEGSAGSVVLISDGLATDQRWGAAVRALEDRGVPLHTVALTAHDDVRPVGLSAEEPMRVGGVARVWVDIAGSSAQAVEVTLTGPGGIRSRATVTVPGRAVLELEPKQAGFLPLEARVGTASWQTIAKTFAVQDPLRVLYYGHRMQGAAGKLGELLGPGFDVQDGRTDGGLPADGIDGYDLVMLDDRPKKTLPEATQKELVDAVRSRGVGMLVCGGGASFGAGGYHETPIAQNLPVEFIHKEEKKDPSTSLALIIDTSGSMTGNRIRIAKEVARLAIRRLLPHDKIGIVEFYGAKRWAAPLQSAANAIDIQRALNRLDAGGGTILLPAIEEAYYGLKNVQTRYKHVMVLTDAGVETGAYESLMRRMARDGICVSTILCGPGRHSEFLVQVADWGNGRYYNASNRFNLPEIMLKQPSTSRLPSYRPGEHILEPRAGAGWWGQTDPTALPPLAGYVESKAKPGAEVVLRTAADNHPVIASWRIGLGRMTAMMTEPTGPGTEPWRDSDEYGAFLARVMTRTAADQRLPYRFELRRDDHALRLFAWRRTRLPAKPLAAVVDATGRGGQSIAFRERADGVWTADFVADPEEIVHVLAGTDRGAQTAANE